MRFVKFKENGLDVTKCKEYEVKFETELEVCIMDDLGDLRNLTKHATYFEIIDRPVMVKALEKQGFFRVGLELVHDLGESFQYRYVCKDDNDNITVRRNIEYIEEKPKTELTLEEIAEKFNIKVEDLKIKK